jgi:flagellar hook assembly protein FlgD
MQLTITSLNAYPNPFNNEVKVELQINLIDADVSAQLEVFNSNGSLVSSTDNKLLLSQGYKNDILTWNGRTSSGANLPPGVYLLVVKAVNNNSKTVKAARVIKSN